MARATIGTTPDVDLRERRIANKLTKIETAIRAEMTLTHYASLEAGYRPKRGDAVERVIAVFEAAEADRANNDAPAGQQGRRANEGDGTAPNAQP